MKQTSEKIKSENNLVRTKHSSYSQTNGLQILVSPSFLPGHREDKNSAHKNFFRYTVTVLNRSMTRMQIIRRHWTIINAEGDRADVDGPGVVGEYPYIEVGENYEYSSHCAIDTAWGTMEGYYTVRRNDGTTFRAMVKRFYLVKDNTDA